MPDPITLTSIKTRPVRKMTQAELDSFLEKAADILRGNIDHSEFRGYVFALLFYKRISDVYQEEVTALEREVGDAAIARDPRMHNFVVPEEALWERVTSQPPRMLGTELNEAMTAIERANQPKFDGLLTNRIDFNKTDELPRDKLVNLINHFKSRKLDRAHVSDDLFGDAYEYLIRTFASKAGKSSGEFYTPPEVAFLMAQIIEPQPGHHICDWACGSGGLLLQSVRYVRSHGGDPNKLFLYGQESNLSTFNIARLNLILHGIRSASLRHGDSLRRPQHLKDNGTLKEFDRIVMNPPFSLEDWGVELVANGDPYVRMTAGTPPAKNGDYAWMQQIVASLKDDGKAMVVMSQGILFRGQPEQTEEEDGTNRKADDEYMIRSAFVRNDWIEMVIVLPSKLFYGNNVPGCLVLLNKNKSADRAGKILMIYAARHYENNNPQNILRPADLMRVLVPWHAFGDLDRLPEIINEHEAEAIAHEEEWRAEQLREIAEAYDPVIEQLDVLRTEQEYLAAHDFKTWQGAPTADHPFFGPLLATMEEIARTEPTIPGLEKSEQKEAKRRVQTITKELRAASRQATKEMSQRRKELKRAIGELEKLEATRNELAADVNAKADRELAQLREAAADLRRICSDPDEARRYFSVVERPEIEENEFNLNMPRYVDTFEPEEEISLDQALTELEAARTNRKQAEVALESILGMMESLEV